MKTNFKKLAMAAGVTTALAGMSIPAHAIMLGDPGEAALVPLAVHVQSTGRYMNTVVKITVPKSVGNDVIPNVFTASHSSPTNGTAVAPGSEAPGDVQLAVPGVNGFPGSVPTTSYIHWYWLNERSVEEMNGNFPVSQDDTAVFDWAAVSQASKANRLGYLVFVTETATTGKAADFSFFTDAYLVAGTSAVTNTKVAIPSLPMDDGADVSDAPTQNNNVVEISQAGQTVVNVSPLVTGMRTIWSDGKPNNYVFDLPLARNAQITGTIAVIWNDRNGAVPALGGYSGPWASVPAYRFNNNEQKCSSRISLPDELNLIYIPPTVAAPIVSSASDAAAAQDPYSSQWFGGTPPPGELATGVSQSPEVVPVGWDNLFYGYGMTGAADGAAYAAINGICTNVANDDNNFDKNGLPSIFGNVLGAINYINDAPMNGGFVKLVTPEPADNALFAVEGSAVMFTIPVFNNTVFGWWGYPLFNSSALLGHPAGAFTTAPN